MIALPLMATTISSGTSTSTCHGQRVKFQIEMLASWTRVAFLLAALLLGSASGSCHAAGSSPSFGFSIHHRFSDAVRAMFPAGDLPERGTVHYFAAMAERDRIHGRRLAAGSTFSAPLTFIAGNTTYRLRPFGFLYFANVSVGTPGLDFLVALDTGSDLFWLPCDCYSCVTGIKTRSGEIPFHFYGLNTSSTGKQVSCASSFCTQRSSCVMPSQCPYEIDYLSANTSSAGYLVEDVLHLTTDLDPSKPVDANITFGCGQRQTGTFLDGGAPNGLFGLGMGNISVPSVLASNKITANSFSMCFSTSGLGRISFGDKGTSDQAETPFNLENSHRRYNISVTQVVVGENSSNVDMNAVFDSGTSFTIFTDPSYSIITEAFNSQVKDKRMEAIGDLLPFEFCYEMRYLCLCLDDSRCASHAIHNLTMCIIYTCSSCRSDMNAPSINLTMKGGANYNIINPFLLVTTSDETQCFYCLGIVKDQSVNIIAENFMTGYRIVFDREKMVLGWEESDCNYTLESTSQPIAPQISPMSPQSLPTIPSTLDPIATSATPSSSKNSGATSAQMKRWGLTVLSWVAIWLVTCF